MKILKMTATFGCLDQAVLEPQDGLNVFVMANETGKSTWSAFLLAMFYGLDHRRAAKGRLAEKHRYQPWNGKAMSGVIELEHKGKTLVLQRTSDRSRPFGNFRAWDRQTGLDVPGLTAENCGRVLLGVEKEVFRRSAFLTGGELTVTQDEDLARRLGSLAASGSAEDSYPRAEARLKLWQNRLRYHRTGLIPQTEDRLTETEELLQEISSLRARRLEGRLEAERSEHLADRLLEEHLQAEQDRAAQLRKDLEQANIRAETLADRASCLPRPEELHRMALTVEQLAKQSPRAEAPCPPALEGLTAEEVWPKAQADAALYERLTAGRLIAMPVVFLIYAALCLTACAVLLLTRHLWAGAAMGALTAVCLLLWLVRRRQDRSVLDDRRRAKALLASYGVKKKEALLTAAVERRDDLQDRERLERQSWEYELAMERIREFSPAVQTDRQALEAVEQALQLQDEAARAMQDRELAHRRLQEDRPLPPDGQIEQLRRSCIRLRAEQEGLLQQEQLLGGFETLEARRQELQTRLEELQARERAVSLAREALAAANARLTQVYAPQLTGLAGQYLHRLTGGRYDGVLLEQDLALSVRESATELVRPLLSLSRGAQDQTWLALRLAMTRLLLPEDSPIVLDDALLSFDRVREQAALEVLRQEGRQVLLFACRTG